MKCVSLVKAVSAVTEITDPYRAGVALGKQLSDLDPEVVILFSSYHAGKSPKLLEGVYDVLGKKPYIVGATGDGIYSPTGSMDVGTCALGLNSEGHLAWHLVAVPGVISQPTLAMREALDRVCQYHNPSLAFLFTDFRADASKLEKVMAKFTACPIVGGFAGDDRRMQGCGLYANDELVEDQVVLLVAEGNLDFSIRIAHDADPIGKAGKVTSVNGRHLLQIDDLTAQQFVVNQLGRQPGLSDVINLVVIDADTGKFKRTRATLSSQFNPGGSIELYAGLTLGDSVQLYHVTAEPLLREVERIGEQQKNNDITAAILISCTDRRSVLGQTRSHEVTAITRYHPNLPIIGISSFGEFAPLTYPDGQFTPTLFHNMTYVLLTLNS